MPHTLRRAARTPPWLPLGLLTKIQRVALIVLEGELSRAPRRIVHVSHQSHSVSLQRVGGGPHVIRPEIEVEVIPLVHELDRRVLLVDELEVEDLLARPDARVEVLVLELEREPDLLGVEPDRLAQVRRAQLRDDIRDRHARRLYCVYLTSHR